jgi:putative transposase
MSSTTQPVIPGEFYHIYNRATGNESLFRNDAGYLHWISLFKEYVLPFCEVYAYCLLPNHFHLLLRINENISGKDFSKAMSDLANSYAKWVNVKYGRKGTLFMRPFKRKRIEDDFQLCWTFWYIHRNPLHHKYTNDWAGWNYSSYQAYISGKPTVIKTKYFIDFFGGLEKLKAQHQMQAEEYVLSLVGIE